MFKQSIFVLCALMLFTACQQTENNIKDSDPNVEANPAAEGFNAEASDPKAIAIADSVMQALGGRKNWDDTRIIQWNFFGRRTHTWDKSTGKDRLEIPANNVVMTFNINTKEGTVTKNGEEITQPDSLKKYLDNGYKMWVNDSYWLLMPYKLKDSGVTLRYEGTDTTQAGEAAYKLKITFNEVGVTPQNKYFVYVDTTDYMVREWRYYPEADMDEPGFILPWKDYQKHGNIMLSGNRGKYTLSNIKVMDAWPETE